MRKIISAIFLALCFSGTCAAIESGHGHSEGHSFHDLSDTALKKNTQLGNISHPNGSAGPTENRGINSNPFSVGTFFWWIYSPFSMLLIALFIGLCALIFRFIKWLRRQ